MPRRIPALPSALASFAASVLLAGCGVVGGSSATDTPTVTQTPEPTLTRTPTRTPTPVPTETPTPMPTDTPAPPPGPAGTLLPQGRTLVLRVAADDAASATATFRGDTFQMLRDGDSFWVPVGASSAAALGDFPVTYTLYDAQGASVGAVAETVSVSYTEYPTEYITLPPGQIESITPDDAQAEINIRASIFARFTPEKLWNGPFIYPSSGPISAAFGEGRSYNGAPVSSRHSGTDFAAEEGSPVTAAASGRVAFAGYLATRGNSVIVDHGAGVFTGYHHMSRIDVAEGQDVAQGQQVGLVGMTGLATGPHLHWELIVGGVNVDPVFWTYEGIAP